MDDFMFRHGWINYIITDFIQSMYLIVPCIFYLTGLRQTCFLSVKNFLYFIELQCN